MSAVPCILGIDPSITCIGWAHNRAGYQAGHIAPPKKGHGSRDMPRQDLLYRQVRELVEAVQPDLVVYEGYSMGKFMGKIFDRAELGGMIKHMLYRRGIPVLLVPPANLKLFATGKGNCDKTLVGVEMARLYGKLFATDDEADAFALLQMGLTYSVARHRPRDPRHYKLSALRGCTYTSMAGH